MAKGKGRNKKKQNNNKYNKNAGQERSDQAGGVNKKADGDKKQKKTSTSSNDGMTDLFKDERVITSHQAKLNDNWAANNSVNIPTTVPPNLRPRGLNNLGNTCYFNSVLQVLTKTPGLRSMLDSRAPKDIPWTASHGDFIRGEGEEDSPLETILPSPNEVMIALIVALRSMDNVNQKGPFSPGGLLNEVSRKNSQFRGRQQQDSHELLRTLLDLIKTGESNRQKEAVLRRLEIEDVKNIDDDTKALIKNYSPACNFTLVDSLFGGYTLSSIRCSECDSISQIMEPFFDLSLPINDNYSPWKPATISNGKKKGNQKNGTCSSLPIALPPPPPPPLPPLIFDPINKKSTADETTIDQSKKQKKKELEKNTHVNERKQKRQEKKASKRAIKEAARSELSKKKIAVNDFSETQNVISDKNEDNWDEEEKEEDVKEEKEEEDFNLDSGDKMKCEDSNEGKNQSDEELSDLDVGIVPLLDDAEDVPRIEVTDQLVPDERTLNDHSVDDHPVNDHPVDDHPVDDHPVKEGGKESDQNKAIFTYQVTEDPKSFEIKVGIETEKTVHLQFDHKSSKGVTSVEYDSNQNDGTINTGLSSTGLTNTGLTNTGLTNTDLMKKKESLDSDVGTSGTPPDDENQSKQRSLDSEDEGISEGDGDSSTKAVIDDEEQLEQVSVNLDDFNDIDDPDENIFDSMANLFGDCPTDPLDQECNHPDFGGFEPSSHFEPPDFDDLSTKFEIDDFSTKFESDKLPDFSVFDMRDDSVRPGVEIDEELNNLKLEDLSDPVEVSPSTTIDLVSEEDPTEDVGDDSTPSREQVRPATVDPSMKLKVEWSMKTIKSRPVFEESNPDPSLESCLSIFTQPEVLTGGNKLFCETCTKRASPTAKEKGQSVAKVFSDASKSMIIAYPPPVLTLHLKRFTAYGFSLSKISRSVRFPFDLDLSGWTSNVYPAMAQSMGVGCNNSLKYKLFGLVEHSGTLKFGHYTATIKVSGKRRDENLRKFLRLKPFVSSVENFLKKLELSEKELMKDCLPTNHEEEEKENKGKNECEDKWYYISDSHVSEVKESDVLATEAYLLFYERI